MCFIHDRGHALQGLSDRPYPDVPPADMQHLVDLMNEAQVWNLPSDMSWLDKGPQRSSLHLTVVREVRTGSKERPVMAASWEFNAGLPEGADAGLFPAPLRKLNDALHELHRKEVATPAPAANALKNPPPQSPG
jgi:hypothetical protein